MSSGKIVVPEGMLKAATPCYVLELTSDPDLVNWIEQMARIEGRSR